MSQGIREFESHTFRQPTLHQVGYDSYVLVGLGTTES